MEKKIERVGGMRGRENERRGNEGRGKTVGYFLWCLLMD